MPQKYDKAGALLSGKPADKAQIAALAKWRAVVKKAKGRDVAEDAPRVVKKA